MARDSRFVTRSRRVDLLCRRGYGGLRCGIWIWWILRVIYGPPNFEEVQLEWDTAVNVSDNEGMLTLGDQSRVP